ncbi:putative Zn-dependent protease [Arthrobacter ginsengisoli]|uniref:Zn-dependent protease n=1 Tax=Arthrobacter ginsengisoli TaxID=1356565 RepID=A0ABU1U6X8_9MICC|nr:tetratricopeptide repeat protein [Arthrobacter ginsengisoli]MDR7080911.1 putative Zn-dependent protease [Arthrobacter ginsengisoli]
MPFIPGGTSDWPDAGLPGIRINPDSLVPQIVDDEAVAAALAASTDPGDLIFVRLVEGHPAEAAELLAEARYNDPAALRLRIFEADVLRVSHRVDRAVELFRQLLAETRGTPDEADIRQLLGRSYFASGNIAAAVDNFAKELDLRVSGSADAALIYASTVALQRARDVLDRAS